MSTTLDLIELDQAVPALSVSSREVALTYRSLLGSSGSTASSFLSCARALESLGMDEEALDAYCRALESDVLCWEAYLGRGEILLGRFVELEDEASTSDLGVRAVADFERALSLVGSGRGDVFRAFVNALLVAGDYRKCAEVVERWFEEGHEEEPDMYSDLLYALGFARLFSGKGDRSIDAFCDMERLRVSVADSLFGRAVCGVVMKNNDLTTGERLALGPQLAGALSILEELGCNCFLDVARALLSTTPVITP